jgi:hypothetical protein
LLHCKSKKVVASKNLALVSLHEKQSNTIENHEEMVVASKNLALVSLHEKQSNTIENHEEMVVAKFAEISPIVQQQVESSCDADVESLFAIGDDVVGLSLMSREVTHYGTNAISTG